MSGGMIILIAVLIIMVVGLGMTAYMVIWSLVLAAGENENTQNEVSSSYSRSSDTAGGYDGGSDSYSSD